MKKYVFGVVGIGDPYLILSYRYKNVQNSYSLNDTGNLFTLKIAVLYVCLK